MNSVLPHLANVVGGLGGKYSTVYSHFPDIAQHNTEFECMELAEKDVGQFLQFYHSAYDKKNKSGPIKISRLMSHLKIEKSKFALHVFSSYDKSRQGRISFLEFVYVMWNYCTLEGEHLERCIFDSYDIERKGHMEVSDVKMIIRDMYGANYSRNQVALRAYFNLEEIEYELMAADHFCILCEVHDQLMFPAIFLQKKLQDAVMGTSFWHRHRDKRLEICRHQFLPVDEIIRKQKRKFALERRSVNPSLPAVNNPTSVKSSKTKYIS